MAGGERVALGVYGRPGSEPHRGTRPGASRARRRRSPSARKADRCAARGSERLLHRHVLDALLDEGRAAHLVPVPQVELLRRRSARAARWRPPRPRAPCGRLRAGSPRQRRRRGERSTASRPRPATPPRNSRRQVPITRPPSTATMWVASGSRPSRSASTRTPCSSQKTRSRSSSAAASSSSVRTSRTSTGALSVSVPVYVRRRACSPLRVAALVHVGELALRVVEGGGREGLHCVEGRSHLEIRVLVVGKSTG